MGTTAAVLPSAPLAATLSHPQPQVRLLALQHLAARAQAEYDVKGAAGETTAVTANGATDADATPPSTLLFLHLCATAVSDDWPVVRAAALTALETAAPTWARLCPLPVRLAALNKRATLPRRLLAASSGSSSSSATLLLDHAAGSLLLACEDESSSVRRAAARALGALGAADAAVAAAAAPALCSALARDDADASVRGAAVRAAAGWFEAFGGRGGRGVECGEAMEVEAEEEAAAAAAAAATGNDDEEEEEEGEIVLSEAEAAAAAEAARRRGAQRRPPPKPTFSPHEAEALHAAVEAVASAAAVAGGSAGAQSSPSALILLLSILAERAVLPHRQSLLVAAQALSGDVWLSASSSGEEEAAVCEAARALGKRNAALVRSCRGDLLRFGLGQNKQQQHPVAAAMLEGAEEEGGGR